MIYTTRASHIGSCFSVVDILNILYAKILDVDPAYPKKPDRDFLIMSKGHAAAALYSILAYYNFISFVDQWNKNFCPAIDKERTNQLKLRKK